MAAAALATETGTRTTAVVADTGDVMTMALAAHGTRTAATEVAVVTTMAPGAWIAMRLSAGTIAAAVVVTTTTGLLHQLLAATTRLLRVRDTGAEDARTRVTTIAHTASSPLTQAEPKRY